MGNKNWREYYAIQLVQFISLAILLIQKLFHANNKETIKADTLEFKSLFH